MKQITVATYNIRHGHDVGCDWNRIAAVIRTSGADIIGLQEIDMGTNRVGGRDSVAGLTEATGMPYALFIPAMDFDGGQYGTAILSRYPITDAEVHPLPSAHYEPRAFGRVTVTVEDGTSLTCLNTHLSYESEEQQGLQMAFLADWMERHIPVGAPAVLTGDFNTEKESLFSPLCRRGYSLVNNLSDGAANACKTFRTDPVAIDNILYRGNSLVPCEIGMIDRDTSDHNLLWCRFELA